MQVSEWAQRKVQSVQAATEAEAVRDALHLERQRIRTSNFPDQVQAVVESFQRHCEEYNKVRVKRDRSVGFYPLAPTSYVLRRDAGFSQMTMQVNFDACALRVSAQNCDFRYDRIYRPEAMNDGGAMLSSSEGHFLVTPDDVAREAMDAFLDGRELADRL